MSHSKEKIQLVNELHRPARKKFPRRRIIIKGLDDLWQMDLAEMRPYASVNKDHKLIMVVIDCFSKYLWTRPLKSKTGAEIARAFADILSHANNRIPKNLQTDQGTEFYNEKFQSLMKKFSINHYHTYTIMKAAIAERVIRTLNEKLYKFFSLNGSYRWIDVLPEITKNYNDTKHTTIRCKPSDVTKASEQDILKSVYNHIKIAGIRKFNVGDIVRISKAKHVFEKNYTPNWTTELFKIVKVRITKPTTYILEDLHGTPIKGAFYPEELQKTINPDIYLVEKVLRKKGKKVFVKWLGFDDTHNSWIDSNNKL